MTCSFSFRADSSSETAVASTAAPSGRSGAITVQSDIYADDNTPPTSGTKIGVLTTVKNWFTDKNGKILGNFIYAANFNDLSNLPTSANGNTLTFVSNLTGEVPGLELANLSTGEFNPSEKIQAGLSDLKLTFSTDTRSTGTFCRQDGYVRKTKRASDPFRTYQVTFPLRTVSESTAYVKMPTQSTAPLA
jgi:hypothetical protein